MTASPVVVLGLGNILRGDDGVGVHALRALANDPRRPAEVRWVDGGTLGLELACYLMDAACVLVLDAVECDRTPGALVRLAGTGLNGLAGGKSAHALGLADLLHTVALIADPMPELVLLGVQPESTDWSVSLSAPVAAALPALVEAALAELHPWTRELQPCV